MKVNLKQLMWDKGLTQTQLADIMGVNQSVISKFVLGKREPLDHHVEKLIAQFGKDVVESYREHQNLSTPHTQEATVTIYDPEIVEELKEELIEEVRAEEIKTTFVLPPDVVRNPEVNIKRDIEKGELDDYTKPIQDCLPMHDCIVQTYCDDMEPEIRCGERVLAQILPKGLAVTPGQIYFIDLPSGGVIRYIVREESGKLYLKARNSSYGDMVVERKDVQSLWLVRLILRSPRSMNYKESMLAEMIERKDEHLSDMLATNNKLIDELCKRNERTDKMVDELLRK
ncbi:MAG: LexA family transcriptional regulator [Paludibacteraceae bacterium]|nr:LexA family transcriptional regulator [Paludibacteraceae bacterium]